MKRTNTNTLMNYFSGNLKKNKTEPSSEVSNGDKNSSGNGEGDVCASQASTSSLTSPTYDVSIFKNKISIGPINSEDKINILSHLWVPNEDYDFPSRQIGNQKRKFSHGWLKKFKWLAYSGVDDLAYCKICMAFAPDSVGMNSTQSTSQLVKVGFCNWKKALEQFGNHQSNIYHCDSVIKAENFTKIIKGETLSIDKSIDKSRAIQAAENRAKLKPIIDTIDFCGRRNIALRGHRDSGPFDIENPPDEDEGNFRALLREKIKSGDSALVNHFKTCGRNATYISWNVQNQIIEACHEIIIKELAEEINNAKWFSVLADETTDVSTIEQFSLCVRYVKNNYNNEYVIQEKFLKFLPLSNSAGKTMAEKVISGINECGLDLKYLRGQGYDGAASMSGKFNGTQAHIINLNSKAIYVHCAAHSLNLALMNAASIPAIRNSFGVVEKIWAFFNTPKRQTILVKKIEDLAPEMRRKKLKQLCPTRWAEKHEAVIIMVQLIHVVSAALEDIRSWDDRDSSSGAYSLLCAIQQPDFIISLLSAEKLLTYTMPLCKALQSTDSDLSSAIENAEEVISAISLVRKNLDHEFSKLFLESKEIAEQLGSEITLPRIVKGRQQHRLNVPADSTEEYYRRSIFIPWIDNFIANMKERFSKHKEILIGFSTLLPTGKRPDEDQKIQFVKLVNFYEEDLGENHLNKKTVLAEYETWHEKFINDRSTSTLPKNAIEALNICSKLFFPTIHILLSIFCTIPVSTCTPERSFSTLKRLKTYLRNSIGSNRLNGLASLNIHKNITIKPDDVIDFMAHKSSRKLDFIL